MKSRFAQRFLGSAHIVLTLSAIPVAATSAATFYWDTNPSTVAAGNNVREGGAGTWDTINSNFTTSETDDATVSHNIWSSALNSAGKDTVIFGGNAGGAVTVNAFGSGGQISGSTAAAFNNLTFDTTGYTLNGNNQFRFVNNGTTGGSITVKPGVIATINNAIQGSTTGGLSATGTADGQVDTSVDINGGGTLRVGGGNGSLGFNIAAGTTVEVIGGSFSGYNLNNLEGTIKVSGTNLLSAPSSLFGTGSLDLNNTSQTVSTIGGALSILNTGAAVQNVTLSLCLTSNSGTHTGVIANGISGGKVSLATIGTFAQGGGFNNSITFANQTLAGANTFTGSTSLGRGTVILDFTNAAAPMSNILYNTGFGTATGDDGKLIISRPVTSINGVANSASGTSANLTITGKASTANTQQFSGLKIDSNAAANLLLNPGNSPGTLELNLGSSMERASGGLINFGTAAITTALSPSVTVKGSFGTADSILLDATGTAFATLGGRDWAAKNAANDAIVPATYTTVTPSTLSGVATTVLAGGGANDVKITADTTISALRYANNSRAGISLGGKILTTGGILVSNVSGTSANFIGAGTLKPAGSDLVVTNFASSSRTFGVSAVVADGISGSTGLTTGGTSAIFLTANNTYTGALNVQQAGLVVTGTNNPSAININGSSSIATGSHLSGNGTYLQLGNANALGSIGSSDINLGVGALFAIKRSDNITLNHNIRGIGGITHGWSGTTTMLSAPTAKYGYVGDTTVTAGTLKLDYAASNSGILSDSTRLVLGGGTVEYATVAGTTHQDALRDLVLISGASTITKSGSGAGRLRFNTINSQENAGGTLNLAAAGIADTDTTNTSGILGSRARFTVGGSDWATNSTNGGDGSITAFTGYTDLAVSSNVPGTNFAMKTPGTTAISLSTAAASVNSLKIDTAATGGDSTLTIGATSLTLSSGGLLVTGPNNATITGAGSLRSNTAANSDLIIHQHGTGGLTIDSVIANGVGTSTLTKSGSGSLTLTKANTFTGNTFLNGGTTIISSNENLGAPASGQSININNATLRTTANIVLSNGTVGTNNRAINLNGIGGTVSVDEGTTLTVGGSFQGPGGLTKTGKGTLDARSLNQTGPTVITEGTLKFGASVFAFSSDVIVGAEGTLDIAGTTSGIPSLAGAGTVTNTGLASTLSIGTLPNDSTFSGKFTGSLSFEKYSGGNLTLTGGEHTYTGSTIVGGGSLTLTGSGALPATTHLNVSSATGIFNAASANATGVTVASLAGAAGSSVILGDKNLVISGTTDTNFGGSIDSTTTSVTIDRSATATQTFSGPNTYDGVTTITKGVLLVSNSNALGSTVGNTVINSTGSISNTVGTFGGQLALSGNITLAEDITIQGTGDTNNYQKAISSNSGNNTINGIVTLQGNSVFRIGTAAGTLNLGLVQRSAPTAAGQIILDPSVNSVVNLNTALDNNGGTLTIHAGGTVVLNQAGNDVGNTVVQNSSILKSTVTQALPINRSLTVGQGSLANGTSGVGNDVGIFVLNGGDQTVSGLFGYPNSGANPSTTASRRITSETSGAKVVTIGSGFFDGVIEDGSGGGTLSLVKNGSGTLTLAGTLADTYTGDTTIDGGTLALSSAKNLADTSTVRINGIGSRLQLANGASDTVNALVIDGVTQAAGTWGSTASTATNKNDNYFSGTGVLTVTTGGSDFGTWASGFGVGGAEADDDNDGLTNRQEYAFGLIPNSGSSVSPFTSQLNQTTGLFTYTRRKPSLTGLTYTYVYSTTLAGEWLPFTADSESSDSGNPVEAVTVDVPDTLLTNPKLFIRVQAN